MDAAYLKLPGCNTVELCGPHILQQSPIGFSYSPTHALRVVLVNVLLVLFVACFGAKKVISERLSGA